MLAPLPPRFVRSCITSLVLSAALGWSTRVSAQETVIVGGDDTESTADSPAEPSKGEREDRDTPTSTSGPGTSEGLVTEFHGFFRAPMRLGIGKRDNPAAGQSSTTLHNALTPDDQYLSWQYTRHNQRDWAEIYLSVGKDFAKGTVGLEAYNFTDASYNEQEAQLGISQAFVTLTPDLGSEDRFELRAGAHWGLYGEMGRYDAGEYDTYLFGRTAVMGYTAHYEHDLPGVTLKAEQGFGTRRPDPDVFNKTRFTLLHHEHVWAQLKQDYEVGLHFLSSWTQEEDRNQDPLQDQPDGSLMVYGGDLRLDFHGFGLLYAGFSRVVAKDALTIAPAINVIHSDGGGEFDHGITGNYLDTRDCLETPTAAGCSRGNGAVSTLAGQYEISLSNLIGSLRDPEFDWWGEGEDVVIKLYGMLNWVKSDNSRVDGLRKVKYGADVEWMMLKWFGVGARADRLQPNSRVPEQSFMVLSPRVVFRSSWVSNEMLVIQYSRYVYNQRECGDPTRPELCVQPPPSVETPDGFGSATADEDTMRTISATRPDVNVFRVDASMWW
ncbi:MAG: hypothetical protein AB7S68_24070 [Polyangiaceae bacterium]